MFGDCLERMKEIPDNSIDMVLCDPPYGTTKCKWDSVIDFDLMWEQLKRITKDNGAICLFGSEPFSSYLRFSNIKMFKYDWYWNKKLASGHLNAKKQPLRLFEVVSVFYSRQATYYPRMRKGKLRKKGGNNKSSVYGSEVETISYNDQYYPTNEIVISNANRSKLHPTQKPVELLQYLIKTYTLKGETVLDFTFGSCSTGVACMLEGRNFIGIENNKEYFKVGKNRIKNWKDERK